MRRKMPSRKLQNLRKINSIPENSAMCPPESTDRLVLYNIIPSPQPDGAGSDTMQQVHGAGVKVTSLSACAAFFPFHLFFSVLQMI